MVFCKLIKRCIIFLADKETGAVRSNLCRESFLQEEMKSPCMLGLKLGNLRGDYSNIFQIYSGGLGDKSTQKVPLLFTCQNNDNTIKVFDLSIKKGSK
jgi:hypothetical protein